MTTTPYDSLPSGNNHITPETVLTPEPAAPKYIDVEVAPPPAPIVETSKSAPAPAPRKKPLSSASVPAPKPQAALKTVPFSPPPQYSNIRIKNLAGRCEYILPFEESLLVPDTMPDMQKLLFAEGRVDLAQPGKSNYDRNDFLAGDITAYTVYRPVRSVPSPSAGPAAYNDCPVDVVKSVIPFKTDKCWGDAVGDSFKPTVTIRSISAEMINERKFIVRGELLIRMMCICDCEMKVFKAAADEDLMLLKDCAKATSLEHETTDSIDIEQEITLKEDQLAPIKILKTSVRVVENHRQLTSGKLVVNSSIHLEALYLGEDDAGERKLCCLTNKTDFTQFVVMDNNLDLDLICIDFYSGDLSLAIENKDKLLLSGKITALIRAYGSKDIDIVKDAYHKKNDLRFGVVCRDMSHVRCTVNGEISAREVINMSDSDRKPASLLCGSCSLTSVDGHLEKDRIVIEGTMPVKILALDDENNPMVIDHDIPIRGALASPDHSHVGSGKPMTVCIDASVKEFWFSEINSRQLEVNTVLTLTARIFGEETFCTIEDLHFAETDEPQKRISMALYAAAPGDTLWDVAKRYKTDPDTLAALNDIDPAGPLPAGMKLFVSK